MMLCALATIALFANCTRDGQPEEKKNTAETESADLIIKDIYYAGTSWRHPTATNLKKRMTSLFPSTTLPTMT